MERYEKYKPSGNDWIGEIPEHWSLATVGRVSNIGRGRVISNVEIGENAGEYPVYSSQTENNGVMGYLNTFDFDGEYVTWTTDGANAGTVFHRKGKFNCTNVCGTIQPKNWEQIDLRYLPYFLNLGTRYSVRLDINPKLMNNMMAKIPFVIPPKKEQATIANYLDDKTAQIDTLIANKQKLIELLKEERTAIINHAVTKGINPKAKLKPSSVEWLGSIPEHWEVQRLKNVINGSLQNGIFKKSVNFGDGCKLVNVSDVYNESFTINENNLGRVRLIDRELQKFKVNADDIFFVRSSLKLEGIAASAIVKVMTEPAVFECHLIKIEPNKKIIHPYFLIYFLNSNLMLHTLVSLSKTTTMTTIGQDSISSLCLWLPPHSEQHAIVEHIKSHENRIHSIVERIEKEIELLQEYRTALISEVVTGKIKVA